MDAASSPAMLLHEPMDLYHKGEVQHEEKHCPLPCTQQGLEISPTEDSLSCRALPPGLRCSETNNICMDVLSLPQTRCSRGCLLFFCA